MTVKVKAYLSPQSDGGDYPVILDKVNYRRAYFTRKKGDDLYLVVIETEEEDLKRAEEITGLKEVSADPIVKEQLLRLIERVKTKGS